MPSIDPRTASCVLAGALVILAAAASPIGDQGFMLIVLVGPVITGAIAARRRRSWKPVAAAWALSAILMLVIDWIVTNEDQLFHLLLAGFMAGLTALGAALGRLTRRHRRSATAGHA